MKMFNKEINLLYFIIPIGFLFRALFIMFGAKLYYGTETFWMGGDTPGWVDSIINLIEHGTYTIDFKSDIGYFFRPPGYSFYIGIFYLLSGKNLALMYQFIIWSQVLLDTLAIYLLYKTVCFAFSNTKIALITAILYAIYPFVIVWNAVVYAESTSVFFLLLSLYFFFHPSIKYKYVLSGIFISIAVLIRVQLIFMFPILGLIILFIYWGNTKNTISNLLQFGLMTVIVYGSWPIRNYINYNKWVFSEEWEGYHHWSMDYIRFYEYIFSVQTGEEPQNYQIIHGEKVTFPKDCYVVKGDSTKLENVVKLCRTCGEGFSYFMRSAGVREDVVGKDDNCNEEIERTFVALRENQKKYNSLNYYLWVPLSNLKKAIFKYTLAKPSESIVGKLASLLFLFRTLLLLLGFMGLIILLKYRLGGYLCVISFLYFCSWYFFDCFDYRSMEIRYFLQADILMLIPAAFVLYLLLTRFSFMKKYLA